MRRVRDGFANRFAKPSRTVAKCSHGIAKSSHALRTRQVIAYVANPSPTLRRLSQTHHKEVSAICTMRQICDINNTGVNQKVLPVLSTETLLHIWLSTEYYGRRPSSTAVDTVSLHTLDPSVPRKRMQIGFLLAPIVKEVSNIVSNLLMSFLLQRLTLEFA